MLNVALQSGESPKRVVLVHGFTQTGLVWTQLVDSLSSNYEALAVDLPGHGETSDSFDGADLWKAAALLGETGGRATYVGYSLGARVALHLALQSPELVERLVLIGVKGGYEDRDAAASRASDDEDLATQLESKNLDEFIDEWLQQPFNARLAPEAKQREVRLRNRVAGLAASLRNAGSGSQESLWSRVHELSMPVLLVTGGDDIGWLAENERMAKEIGENATQVVVPGSGHSVPFEAPAEFESVLQGFLEPPAAQPSL